MGLKHWAYIYLSPGFGTEAKKTTTTVGRCRFDSVGIDITAKEKVLPVAKQLVADGVQLIELCGGFGPIWIARVNEAIQGAVPVGGVFYGPEWRKPLLDVLS